MGISESSYRRLESGARAARRGELIAIAQITGQASDFFESASFDNAAEGGTVTPSDESVKQAGGEPVLDRGLA